MQLFRGYLQKKKVKGGKFFLGRQWRWRYFVLWENGLEYFTDDSMSQAKGFMDLKDVAEWSGQGKRYGMELMTKDETLYRLCADNEQERDDWIGKLQQVCDSVQTSGELSYSLSQTGALFGVSSSSSKLGNFLPFKNRQFLPNSMDPPSPGLGSPAARLSGNQPLRRLSEMTPISFGTMHPSISLDENSERHFLAGGANTVVFSTDETGTHLASMWEWCQMTTGDRKESPPRASLQSQYSNSSMRSTASSKLGHRASGLIGSTDFDDDDDDEDEVVRMSSLQTRVKTIEFFKELTRKLEGDQSDLLNALEPKNGASTGTTGKDGGGKGETPIDSYWEYKKNCDAVKMKEAEASPTLPPSSLPKRSHLSAAEALGSAPYRSSSTSKRSSDASFSSAQSQESNEGLPAEVLEELGHFMESVVVMPENMKGKFAPHNGLTVVMALEHLVNATMTDESDIAERCDDAMKVLSEAVTIFRATHLAVRWHQCRSVLYFVVPHAIELLQSTAAACVKFWDTCVSSHNLNHEAMPRVRELLYWCLGIASILVNESGHLPRLCKMLGSHFCAFPTDINPQNHKRDMCGVFSYSRQSELCSTENPNNNFDWDEYLMSRLSPLPALLPLAWDTFRP